ncbi:unnamed protein product, partial [Mesorhabditis spiculigera]
MAQSFLPMFLKQHFAMPIHQNGFFTMLPFCTQLISKNLLSPFADRLKQKGVNPTTVGRSFQAISAIGSSISLLVLALLPSDIDRLFLVPFLLIFGITLSCALPGHFTSILTMAPDYTGTLSSICSIFGALGNLSGPWLLSIANYTDIGQKWLLLFSITSIAQLSAGALFIFHGSAEIQPWAKKSEYRTALERDAK